MSKYTRKPRYATNDVYNATEGAYNVVEPSEAKKDLGHDYKEKPPRQYFNWLARQGHQWLDYLDDEVNQFAAHAADPVDMTVIIDAGRLNGSTGPTVVAAQTTIAFAAPSVGNLRIDRIVIDQETGAHSVLTGVEDPTTPVAPAIASGKLAVCQVALADSTTSITDDDITDERVAFDSITRGGAITGDVVHTGDVAQTGDYVLTGDLTVATDLIVTSSVGATLDVVATTDITGDTSIVGDLVVNTDDLVVETATGKVGINDATPDAGLDVNTTLRVQSNTNAPSAGEGLEISYDATGNTAALTSYDRTGAAHGDLRLYGHPVSINGSSGTENYTVGVGTSSPVAVASAYSGLQIGNSQVLFANKGSKSTVGDSYVCNNIYYDGSWKAINTGKSLFMNLTGGEGNLDIYTAPSQTAGATPAFVIRCSVKNDGGITIGSPTGDSKGAGTLNVENNIYWGNYLQSFYTLRVSTGGTIGQGPSGWTASKTATGTYTITHNLGLSSVGDLNIIPAALNGGPVVATLSSNSTNSFVIETFNTSGVNVDSTFTVFCHRHTL